MNQGIPSWTTLIGSEKLIKKLLAFTKAKIVFRSWANGGLPKGYLFSDVVQDAIVIYLKEFLQDTTHQATEEELKVSLQKMIINRLKVLSELKDNCYGLVDTKNIENESFLPTESTFDNVSFEESVYSELEDAPELWKLFSDLYFHESDRAELIEQYQITISEYDNRARRLRRKITPLLNTHNLHRHGKIREKIKSSFERACPELV